MVLNIILAVVAVILLFLLWVAIYDTNRFTVSHYEYKDSKIKKNCRAVVLSDLHNMSFGKDNERLIEGIVAQNPDFILVAGDIINGKVREKLDVALGLLEKLSQKYPIYYGNGNHEMRMKIYAEDYGDKGDFYFNTLKEYGVKVLVNDRILLDEYGLCIIGSEIDKKHYKRMGIVPMEEGELLKDLGATEDNYYNVLLAHNPDFFMDYMEYGAELTLSGHIHGGIVRIPFINKGVLSPNVTFFPKYDGGEYTKEKSTMLVSRGLGAHTIPFRLFNPGDLVVIDFMAE